MPARLYTLAEVVAMGYTPAVTDPERWLRRRLNSGQLRGIQFGRSWKMTDAHVAFMLKTLSNDDLVPEPEPEPAEPPTPIPDFWASLSTRSRNRLRRID